MKSIIDRGQQVIVVKSVKFVRIENKVECGNNGETKSISSAG